MEAEEETPLMIEVRKCLKEADSYDPTLSENEMLELYQVLKDSQKTATEEDEQRKIFTQMEINCSVIEEMRINNGTELDKVDEARKSENTSSSTSSSEEDRKAKIKEKPFAPKKWYSHKKQVKPIPDLDDQVPSTSAPDCGEKPTEEETEELTTVDCIDVFNSVPTAHKPLKLISPRSKYNPPIYCDPKYANLDIEERARMIANYHLKLQEKFNNYQRQSLFPAPWGKPIQGEDLSLAKKPRRGEEAIKEDKRSDEDEVYVSKSGRQTKRKLYTDNIDNNDEWKRKPKSTSNDEQDTKKTHPKKRRLGVHIKDDIMKRSKLFADNVNSSRTNKLFDKLIEEDAKTTEIEKKREKFKDSLDSSSGDENVENSVDIEKLVHDEEPFIRRRVVPPSYTKQVTGVGKNQTRGRPKGKIGKGIKKSASSESSSQEMLSEKYDHLDIAISTNSGSAKQKAACPVCFEQFFQDDLLEHAPACLDISTNNEIVTKPVNSCQSTITCYKCDKIYTLDMDYENHVLECFKK